MAEHTGLQIVDIVYDSNSFQFYGSKLYEKGKLGRSGSNLKNVILYAFESLLMYSRLAKQLNKKHEGDQAILFSNLNERCFCFIIVQFNQEYLDMTFISLKYYFFVILVNCSFIRICDN